MTHKIAMDFIDLKTPYQQLKGPLHQRMQAVLERAHFIMGPEVGELEEALGRFTGASFAIACGNGTDALQLALMSLELQPGDEVITTAFSYVATAEVIALLGLIPRFVDIDPSTYLIDIDQVEACMTHKTRAVIPVSLYGQCPDMDALHALAQKHGITIIEDAAQSMGAGYKDRRSCALSRLATTSFFPSKPLGCYGDGGMVFTSDEQLAQRLRMLRNHGQSKRYCHDIIGVNSRLDTLQAAILLVKLDHFEAELQARQRIAQSYDEGLRDVVRLPERHPTCRQHVYAQYTIAHEARERLRAHLHHLGIPTAVHYPCALHQQPAFKAFAPQHPLPHAERASSMVVSLPMHPYLDAETQATIIQAVKDAL